MESLARSPDTGLFPDLPRLFRSTFSLSGLMERILQRGGQVWGCIGKELNIQAWFLFLTSVLTSAAPEAHPG